MEIIEWIVKLVLINWVLKDLFSFLGSLLYDIKVKNKALKLLVLIFSYVFTCSDKCAVFWFSLIYTQDILVAAITSIIVNYLSQLEYKYKKTSL